MVRSVGVLLRPEADSPRLTGLREVGFRDEGFHDTFRYTVLRVWQLSPAQFLQGGLGMLPLAPVSAVTEAELPGIIRELKQRLGQRSARSLAPQLWAATYILLGLRYSSAVANLLLRGVLSMKESTTYQAILQEGLNEGQALGRAEGRAEEARRMLRLLAEGRFGAPSAAVAMTLDAIHDVGRLEGLSLRVSSVDSWEKLLAGAAPRRRKSRG